ncbi:MAG: murein biosynthesis integral membrane protein MurJ, partial [Allomuricauda sp.]
TVFIGAINNIFVPNYIQERSTTREIGGFQFLTISLIIGICVAFIFLIYIANQYFISVLFPGHTDAYYELIQLQMNIILPCIMVWGLNGFMTALLEIKGKFLFSTFSTIFTAIVTIALVFFFKEKFPKTVLAISLLGGSLISFAYLLIGCLKLKLLKIKATRLNSNMWTMIRQLPAKTAAGLLTAVNPVVDQFFAAQLVAGSVIALSYGDKIPAFLVTISMMALGNVLLPHFSEIVVKDKKKAFKELFKILKVAFIGATILVGIIAIFTFDIIQILFERGKFTVENTLTVGYIQLILLASIPFFILTRILVKFFTSINKNSFMAWAALITVLSNFLLNSWLIGPFQVYGLALSTSLVLILNNLVFVFYAIFLNRKINAL